MVTPTKFAFPPYEGEHLSFEFYRC